MQFFKLISIGAGCVYYCLCCCGCCYCNCSCFLGMRRFFLFACSSLSLPLRCRYNYYVAIFLVVAFIHLIHWEIHIFWFWCTSNSAFGFCIFFYFNSRRFTNILPNSFLSKFRLFGFYLVQYKQFSTHTQKRWKKVAMNKIHNLTHCIYFIYPSIQFNSICTQSIFMSSLISVCMCPSYSLKSLFGMKFSIRIRNEYSRTQMDKRKIIVNRIDTEQRETQQS